MKLSDVKIGTQLRIGLGVFLVFIVTFGVLGRLRADSLWQQTQGLYEHPFTVQRAVGEIQIDILAMRVGMQDLVLAENDEEIQQILQNIDTYESDANRQFAIVYDRYLGPRSDIDAAHQSFVQWKAIRDETIRLLRAGKVADATNRVKSSGVGGAYIDKLRGLVKEMSDFATARGDRFYLDAEFQKDALVEQLGIVLTIIILVLLGVSYFLLEGIRGPLKELTTVAEQYRQGKLDARSHTVSANEFGTLAASFNALAETIQTEMQSKENTARIAAVMLQEQDLHTFCRELLKALFQYTGSQVGAVYLLNEQKTEFEHFESIGLASSKRASFSAEGREGEFGVALATRQIQRITDLPAESCFSFATVSGDWQPREIITIPILSHKDALQSEQEVVAMISLAAVRSYSESAVRLVNEVWSMLTARLNGVLAFRKIRTFSEKLEQQNQELVTQQRELAMQADELNEQNIELELQKKQLDESNRLKSAFLSNMSHELRTPLNSVIALSGVLSRRLRGTIPEEEYSYLDVIERNGKNLLSLINDILDLSRIEAGREEISLNRFSVRSLVDEVVGMIEPQAREKDIALVNRVDDALPLIRSDFAKCRHILQNIVANAVKFTEQGKVEIVAAQVDGGLQIAVTDTGIGIAADRIHFIFDEFRQADESTTRNYGGTGLGLSIAKKYAMLLRGAITVASTPGQGSTFTVRLPLTIDSPIVGNSGTPGADNDALAASGEASSISDARGKCILLVEDSEPAVIQLTDILAEQGYRVQVTRNGRQALEQIERTLPDAMILDLMMPEVDGFQVLKMIRGMEKTAQLPVLILTAKHLTREELNSLKGNHIHQLIQKGDINKTDLLAGIGKMMSPRQNQPTAPARMPAPKSARMVATGKPVILVMEDNPDNLKTVKALLQDTAVILQAADGKAGVVQARANTPDLILMDLSLPLLDGYQALDEIRKDERLRHIPVIALTARAMKGDREEILSYGFDGYISKPIDDQQLEKTIREILYGK